MIAVRAVTLLRVVRPLGATVGLVSLLALQPEPVRLAESAAVREPAGASAARVLILSDQARRYLQLQYRSFTTEFMGCMIGEVRGTTVLVQRIAPADVDPSQSTPTHVVPKQSCQGAGWTGTVGMIHSHPSGQRCWYYFPGTKVPSSDGQSFQLTPYAVDAIMCGERVVWISRDLVEKQTPLGERSRAPAAGSRRQSMRGNQTQHAGSTDPVGGD